MRSCDQAVDNSGHGDFLQKLGFKLDRAFRSVKHMHDTLAAR